MLAYTSHTPDETLAFGRALGQRLAAGDFLCLTGDLGAGKTLLAQGIAGGLGVAENITSPTFTILQVYETGRLSLCHFDLYRLERTAELDDIGFSEFSGADGAVVVEWADKFAASMPDERLWISISLGAEEGYRVITLVPQGDRYRRLCEEMKDFADTCP